MLGSPPPRPVCRVVLAALLHALKDPAEPFYAVARRFLIQRLLAAPLPAAPAAAAEPGSSGSGSGGEDMEIDGGGGGGQATAAGAVVAGQPLAARVLGGLQTKEQGWVRAHVEKWSTGVAHVLPAGAGSLHDWEMLWSGFSSRPEQRCLLSRAGLLQAVVVPFGVAVAACPATLRCRRCCCC